jgi:hypothetical protein
MTSPSYRTVHLAHIIGMTFGDDNLNNQNESTLRLRVTHNLSYHKVIGISNYNKLFEWIPCEVHRGTKITQEVRIPELSKNESHSAVHTLRRLIHIML